MARSLAVTVIITVRTGLGIGVPCGYHMVNMYLVAGIGLRDVPDKYLVNVWVVFIYWMFKEEDVDKLKESDYIASSAQESVRLVLQGWLTEW